jgi:L-ascorbate metabolism protein UlaG (beta-lactamase superfamily)
MLDRIQWLGHGSFLIDGPPTIYINPWRLGNRAEPADIILISHAHYVHFSPADIAKISNPNTRIIGPAAVAREIEGIEVLRPWQTICIGRLSIRGIPAYAGGSVDTTPRPDGLGFMLSLNFFDIYYAGDTQYIPEMGRLHPDIAILPVDGQGTMTASDAAQAVALMKPRYAIPFNWSASTRGEAAAFQRAVEPASQVVVMQPA